MPGKKSDDDVCQKCYAIYCEGDCEGEEEEEEEEEDEDEEGIGFTLIDGIKAAAREWWGHGDEEE